jgi:hypothetical protein
MKMTAKLILSAAFVGCLTMPAAVATAEGAQVQDGSKTDQSPSAREPRSPSRVQDDGAMRMRDSMSDRNAPVANQIGKGSNPMANGK